VPDSRNQAGSLDAAAPGGCGFLRVSAVDRASWLIEGIPDRQAALLLEAM